MPTSTKPASQLTPEEIRRQNSEPKSSRLTKTWVNSPSLTPTEAEQILEQADNTPQPQIPYGNSLLPTDADDRKEIPLCTGVLDYFPAALAEVARVSKAGNDQHNPGQPLHWSRYKSTDQVDCLLRHLAERGTIDVDGHRHSAKLAWRALAILQLELEAEGAPVARGART